MRDASALHYGSRSRFVSSVLQLCHSHGNTSERNSFTCPDLFWYIYISPHTHLLLPFEEEDGQFDDRATFRVSNRRLPVPAFTTSKPNASAVVIQTTLLTVTLVDSAAAAASEASAGGEGLCKPILNGTCIGDNIGAATPTADTASDCCDLCASEHGCTAWTWRHPNTAGAKSCYTKYSCNRLGQ